MEVGGRPYLIACTLVTTETILIQAPKAVKGHSMSDIQDTETFDLKSFFPYQVRIFYHAVSRSVADIYTSKHGLTVFEWRAMAVLGNHQPLSASEVVEKSSLDKVQISRAIKGLMTSGLLERSVDKADKRRVNLMLTPHGNEVFRELVPLVRARERQLLSGLSAKEEATLRDLMARVRLKADDCMGNKDLDVSSELA